MKKEYRSTLRTKKMIRSAFVELLGEKKSMETITVGELAERADIAKSTFYNHYDDIYAVAEEFEDELVKNLASVFTAAQQSANGGFESSLRQITAFLKLNEDIYRKTLLSPDIRFFIEKLKNFIANEVFEKNINQQFSGNANERYVQIRFLTNAYVDTIIDYFRGTLNVTLDEVCEIIIAMQKRYSSNK